MDRPQDDLRSWWRTPRGWVTAATSAVGTYVVMQVTESWGWWG